MLVHVCGAPASSSLRASRAFKGPINTWIREHSALSTVAFWLKLFAEACLRNPGRLSGTPPCRVDALSPESGNYRLFPRIPGRARRDRARFQTVSPDSGESASRHSGVSDPFPGSLFRNRPDLPGTASARPQAVSSASDSVWTGGGSGHPRGRPDSR